MEYHFFADRSIEVDGVRTRYWDEGKGEQTLVLVHGLGGFIENWAYNMATLAESRRVVALDMVGFGRTAKPEGSYTYPYFAAFLERFMAILGIARAIIVGHSLGGGIALKFAIDYPERVAGMVLIGSGGLGLDFGLSLRILTLPLIGEALTRPPRRPEDISFAGLVLDESCIAPEGRRVDFEMSRDEGNRRILLKTLRNNASIFGAWPRSIAGIFPRLGEIKVPVLAFWGRQDAIVPCRYAHVLKKKVPQAELVLLDNCAHAPFLEYPETFNAKTLEFLGTI